MNTYPADMDPECVPLCDALNALPGIRTEESCCGHGHHPFRVFFAVSDLQSISCACEGAGDPVPCVVLDPFGGAGTTGLVADRLGRDAILIELDARSVEIATRRIRGDAGLFADLRT